MFYTLGLYVQSRYYMDKRHVIALAYYVCIVRVLVSTCLFVVHHYVDFACVFGSYSVRV